MIVTWFPHGNPNNIRWFLSHLCELRDEGKIELYSDIIDGKGCYVFTILPE